MRKSFNRTPIVTLLYRMGKRADVNQEDERGEIALHGAAGGGHMKVIEYLTEQGSDVNKKDKTGMTPFNAAFPLGHLDVIKYLISKGVKQNKYLGLSPLHAAAQFGHLDLVSFLISGGSDVNEEDERGKIALHYAAARDHLKVIEYLIHEGSDVNRGDTKGWTPFNAAVCNGHLEVVKLLMINGANATVFHGLTSLYIATQYDHIEVVKYLVSRGYDVNEKSECGNSPLHSVSFTGNVDIVKYLVGQKANVNEQDRDGWTPIHAAAQEGHLDVVKYLVSNGADITLKDKDGFTPLQAASNADHSHIVEYLILLSGDPPYEDTGDTRCTTKLDFKIDGYSEREFPGQQRKAVLKCPDSVSPSECDHNLGHAQCPLKGIPAQESPTKFSNDVLSYPNLPRPSECRMNPVGMPCPKKGKRKCTSDKAKNKGSSKGDSAQGLTGNKSCRLENENGCNAADTVAQETNAFQSKNRSEMSVNPFLYAKPRCLEQSVQSSTVDEIEETKDPTPTKREYVEEQKSIGKIVGHHPNILLNESRKCNRIDQSIQHCKQKRDDQNDETHTGCPTLLIEVCSPTKSGKDVSTKETSSRSIKSIIRENLQDIEDGNSFEHNAFGTKKSSSNLGWTIVNKLGYLNGLSSSSLVLVNVILRIIIALTIFLAGCPVLVAGNTSTQQLTLEAGKPGVIPFHLSLPQDDVSNISPYFTLRFESNQRPFCINGDYDINGFKNPTQSRRFTTSVGKVGPSLCVNLTVDSVDILDGDVYILTVVLFVIDTLWEESVKKEIIVQTPPGPAKCFLTLSESLDYPYEAHCRATTGDVDTTLTCFKNNQKVVVKGDIESNSIVTRAIFLLSDNYHFACCSHDAEFDVEEVSCNDFEWPFRKEVTTTTIANVTSPPASSIAIVQNIESTPSYTSPKDSGSCRLCIEVWPYLYLCVLLMSVVVI